MAGYKIRDEMNDIEEAPGKLWFWELEEAVIDADRCVQCGPASPPAPATPSGPAPTGCPKLVKMCTGCSLCWDFCLRGACATRPPGRCRWPARRGGPWKITGAAGAAGQGLGRVEETYTARVRPQLPGAQDGGVVSALLIALLEAGDLDGALLARESPPSPGRASRSWPGPRQGHRVRRQLLQPDPGPGRPRPPGHDLPPQPHIAVVAPPARSRRSGPCRPAPGPGAPPGSTRSP